MVKKVFSLLVLMFLNYCITTSTAQTRPAGKSILQLSPDDFLIIKISHASERYDRKEINVIYYQDNSIKIHAVLKSNNFKEKQIDTVFTLDESQLTKLNQFWTDFNNKDIDAEQIWPAGTRTFYTILLNGETLTFNNKSGYSLLLDLLAK